MSLELNMSPEQEALLQQQAAAAGMDVAEFVLDAVQEKMVAGMKEEPSLSVREWIEEFERFRKRHKPTGYPLDDSRESIYPDRS